MRLTEQHVELIESGASILIGTRDAALCPECLRGLGAAVHPSREAVTVYANAALAERTLANAALGEPIALTFSRIWDHYTIQLKGPVIETRPATEAERALQERYLAAFAEQLNLVGLPRSVTRQVRLWPSVALTASVRELFLQSPGPGAGRRLES